MVIRGIIRWSIPVWLSWISSLPLLIIILNLQIRLFCLGRIIIICILLLFVPNIIAFFSIRRPIIRISVRLIVIDTCILLSFINIYIILSVSLAFVIRDIICDRNQLIVFIILETILIFDIWVIGSDEVIINFIKIRIHFAIRA